ncbi:MAG: hypothetical protein ACYDBW_05685 [Sulfuricaulis sp.]
METEDKFLNAAKRALESAEKNLDAATLVRLRAARRQALDHGTTRVARPAWLFPAGALAAAVVAIVAVLMWYPTPDNKPLQANLNDLGLLTAPESPDFFADLEFYDWLDKNADAG